VTYKFGTTNAMITTRQYDNLNRVVAVTTTTNGSSATVFGASYAYNPASQRTGLTNADNSRWAYGYDPLGQVTSGKKYWNDNSIVAGQQFEYGFNDIGNRQTAASGGDAAGANMRTQDYAVNNLNQYTQRTVPGYVDILGAVASNASAIVNGQLAYRKGEYYRAELNLDNSASSLYPSITNIGYVPGGTNADVKTNYTANLFVPKTPEIFSYDADGNLTNDGRWSYVGWGESVAHHGEFDQHADQFPAAPGVCL
jgi:YD repeat-containing protein